MGGIAVNWGVATAYLFLFVSIWYCCGYLAGKIAESASMSFGLFFVIGFLLGPFGILIAVIARSIRKRGVSKRRLSVVQTRTPVETPAYYQPDFLVTVPFEAPLPSPPPRYVSLEGMGKCDGCDADNPRDNEFCWKCGELIGLREEA
jgi:hypothetical protein